MIRIDSHQHFWQLSRGDYGWLTPELTELYNDFLPQDLQPLTQASGVSKSILVQAADSVAETEFMLRLAAENDSICGVVGWVDMDNESAVQQIEHFNKDPHFKGIRPMIQDIEDINWMLQPHLTPVFEAIVTNDLCFDALVTPKHLPALLELLQRHPQLKVVIDHGAKPQISSGENGNWYEYITTIASQTTAHCKLSGLLTEAGDDPRYTDIAPYMEHLLACFGANRLMWGSDWPVVNLAANYQIWVDQTETFLAPLSNAEKQAIWAKTAQKFYNV